MNIKHVAQDTLPQDGPVISVVVPIFNEEQLIVEFHAALSDVLRNAIESWEVVYINDGSTDASLELLKGLQAMDPHVVVVELSRNWGHMGAISAGLKTASGRATILMDGDFQDPPEVLPEFIDAWRNGAEVVVGVRRTREERRKLLALLFPLFYRLLGAVSDYPIPLNAGIFGLMDRKAADSLIAMREKSRYLPGMRAWVGFRNAVVYYDRHDRVAGDGKLSFTSRIKYAMDAITGFSYKPLRLSLGLSAFSVSTAVILAFAMLLARSPMTVASLGVAGAVFAAASLVLLAIGVLSEYIARIYDEVRDRPLSLIRQVHRAPAQVAARPSMAANATFTVPVEVRASETVTKAA